MGDAAMFTDVILSRRRRPGRFTRLVPFAAAAAFYAGLLAAILLSQLLVVESIDAPKAAYEPIHVFRGPAMPAPGMQGPGPRERAKGGGDGGRRSDVHARAPLPQPESRPVVVPLAPPEQESAVDGLDDRGSLARGGPPGPGGSGEPGSGGEEPGCEGCPGGDGTGHRSGEPSYFDEKDPRITPPVVILASRKLPQYPDMARRVGVEGTVVLLINIEIDGQVGAVEVLRSPDLRYGFDLAAIEAVRQWRYRPALLAGRPIAVQATVMVEFTISR